MTTRSTSGKPAPTGSAQSMLFELQVEQHQHDEAYHREIARLPLHQRLNHMALHFAKYTGKVASLSRVEDVDPVYTDILIIALSTANILNTRIWNLLPHGDREFAGLMSFGLYLAQTNRCVEMRDELLCESARATGQIAAACEKIDHLEEVSFRSEIKSGIASLATLALSLLAVHHVDPAAAVRSRLSEVKQRLLLHGRV